MLPSLLAMKYALLLAALATASLWLFHPEDVSTDITWEAQLRRLNGNESKYRNTVNRANEIHAKYVAKVRNKIEMTLNEVDCDPNKDKNCMVVAIMIPSSVPAGYYKFQMWDENGKEITP